MKNLLIIAAALTISTSSVQAASLKNVDAVDGVVTVAAAGSCAAVGAVIGAAAGWISGIGAGVVTGGTGFAGAPFLAAAGAKGGAIVAATICGGTALGIASLDE